MLGADRRASSRPTRAGRTWVEAAVDSLAAAAEGEKPDGRHLIAAEAVQGSVRSAKARTQARARTPRSATSPTENSIALATRQPGESTPVQEKWRAGLEEFVKAYPNRRGRAARRCCGWRMAFEFAEDDRRKARRRRRSGTSNSSKNYAGHPHAAKAAGRREAARQRGQAARTGRPEPRQRPAVQRRVAARTRSWWCTTARAGAARSPDDAKKLDALVKEYGPKGLEIVTVCLDHDAKAAAQTRRGASKLPGTHLHAPGGLDASPLAAAVRHPRRPAHLRRRQGRQDRQPQRPGRDARGRREEVAAVT